MPNTLSSPELLPAEHRRLSRPRGWSGPSSGNRSSSGGGEGDGRESFPLELDGEWLGDARETGSSSVDHKVCVV